MHHNLNCSIERSGTTYVGHIELSTSGTANRANVTADSFDGILVALRGKHDEFLKAAEAFHGTPVHNNITHPSEGQTRQVASVAAAAPKAKGGKKAKPGKALVATAAHKANEKAKNKRAKGLVEKVAKQKPRSFASE